MDQEQNKALLQRALVGRMGTVGSDDMPYITPLNYVYEPQTRRIYFHRSPKTGHLLTNLHHNNKVCFEVDEPHSVVATGDYACNTTQVYQSVICFGRTSAVEDTEEKERVLRLLMRKYVDEPTPERVYNPELLQLDNTMVLAMDIEIMTGKHREPPPPRGRKGRRTGQLA
jgi:nitroimidazol reductase NimA-like FMN-containing flavoprotein (pyridoxamine 5'-phosphate oxidase superfamily)